MKVKQLIQATLGISILSLLNVPTAHAGTAIGGPNSCIEVTDSLSFDDSGNFTFATTLYNNCQLPIVLTQDYPLYIRSISGNPPIRLDTLTVNPPAGYSYKKCSSGLVCKDPYGEYLALYADNGVLPPTASVTVAINGVANYGTGNSPAEYQWAAGVNTGLYPYPPNPTYYVVAYAQAYDSKMFSFISFSHCESNYSGAIT